jgi:hypothetical protein
MTDLQTLQAMLERAKIEHCNIENTNADGKKSKSLSVERGYSGFITIFEFDSDGKLLDMGAWE